MAAIINADDGAISGASGLKLSSDTSGALNIQTNGVTAIAISASQVVSFPATTTITFGSLNVTVLTSASATITNLIATSGSITTLTNNPTFGAGTANGMLYLNGSKVVTSGSAVVFDGSNLGVGVTPSAWGSGFKVAQIGTASLLSNSGSNAYFGNNFYYNGTNDKRIVASQASRLVQTAGLFLFEQTATGTADSNITWTTAMTLDASGNLGVGVTSPTVPIEVQSNSGGTGIIIRGRATANSGTLRFYANNGTTQQAKFEASDNTVEIGSLTNVPFLFYANNAERARIASDGSFGIGKSSPSYLLDIGDNPNTGTFIRAQGGFLVRRYRFNENLSGSVTLRFTITMKNLEFTNFFLDLSSHKYDNGAVWESRRFAFQFMCEGSTVRLNQRMANYEYGSSVGGTVFTVGNPPSWTYVSGQTHYFDITVAQYYVSYATIIAEGPGISDATLAVV